MWLASIAALLCWSGSDLFSKMGTKQKDKLSHYKVGIAVGLIMGIHALYEVAIRGVDFAFSDIVTYLPASVFYIASMVIGYISLRYIELSISSPICNCSGAVALLMSIVYFGVAWSEPAAEETGAIFLNGPIIIGVVCIVLGVLSLGFCEAFENEETRALRQQKSNRKYAKSFLAIFLPVLYCILDAMGTFVDTLIADSYVEKLANKLPAVSPEEIDTMCGDTLNVAYEFTWAFMAIVFAIYVFGIKREKLDKKYDSIKLGGGICETIGQVFYMMVVVSEYKIGLVIISAYCAVSLLWSRLFLKEKLSWKHYCALAVVFAGILILGFYDV